jgi:hypothetical protein
MVMSGTVWDEEKLPLLARRVGSRREDLLDAVDPCGDLGRGETDIEGCSDALSAPPMVGCGLWTLSTSAMSDNGLRRAFNRLVSWTMSNCERVVELDSGEYRGFIMYRGCTLVLIGSNACPCPFVWE